MMTREKLAQEVADHIADHFHADRVDRYTPSVKVGRRYVGLQIDGKLFLVTIEIDEEA